MRLLYDGFTTYLSGILYCTNCHSLRVNESSVRARRRTGLMCSAGSLTCPCVPARTQCRLNPRNSSFCVNPREVGREADAAMCHMNCAHLCGQHLSATSFFGDRVNVCLMDHHISWRPTSGSLYNGLPLQTIASVGLNMTQSL